MKTGHFKVSLELQVFLFYNINLYCNTHMKNLNRHICYSKLL